VFATIPLIVADHNYCQTFTGTRFGDAIILPSLFAQLAQSREGHTMFLAPRISPPSTSDMNCRLFSTSMSSRFKLISRIDHFHLRMGVVAPEAVQLGTLTHTV
jgi:hypothetical protein